jgi:hypothetical protein
MPPSPRSLWALPCRAQQAINTKIIKPLSIIWTNLLSSLQGCTGLKVAPLSLADASFLKVGDIESPLLLEMREIFSKKRSTSLDLFMRDSLEL